MENRTERDDIIKAHVDREASATRVPEMHGPIAVRLRWGKDVDWYQTGRTGTLASKVGHVAMQASASS